MCLREVVEVSKDLGKVGGLEKLTSDFRASQKLRFVWPVIWHVKVRYSDSIRQVVFFHAKSRAYLIIELEPTEPKWDIC